MGKKKTTKRNDSWPKYVPVFKQDMILTGEPDFYEKDEKRTPFGWLLELFLDTPEWGIADRRNLDVAIKEFKRHAPGVRDFCCIEEWEDEQDKAKLVKALNATMEGLGYTQRDWLETENGRIRIARLTA